MAATPEVRGPGARGQGFAPWCRLAAYVASRPRTYVQIVASPAGTREKLEAYVRLHVNAAIRYKPYYVVLMADQHQLSPQALRGYQSWAREVNHTAEQLLRQGIEEGVVRAGIDVAVTVNLLNSALTSIVRWYRPADRLKPGQVVDQVLNLLSGLLIPQATSPGA